MRSTIEVLDYRWWLGDIRYPQTEMYEMSKLISAGTTSKLFRGFDTGKAISAGTTGKLFAGMDTAKLIGGFDTGKVISSGTTSKLFRGFDTGKAISAGTTGKLFAGMDTAKLIGGFDTGKVISSGTTSKLFGGADTSKLISAAATSELMGVVDVGPVRGLGAGMGDASTSFASRLFALRVVEWVEKLPDRDSRAVILKTGGAILGLVAAAVAYQEAGLEMAAVSFLWALYYILDLANSLIDRNRE